MPKLGLRDAVPHKSPRIKVVPEVSSGAVLRSFWDSVPIFFAKSKEGKSWSAGAEENAIGVDFAALP